jgi:hypothetical protein
MVLIQYKYYFLIIALFADKQNTKSEYLLVNTEVAYFSFVNIIFY